MSHLRIKGNTWVIFFYWRGRQYSRSLGLKAKSGNKILNRKIAERMQAEIDYLLRTGNFDMQKYFAREAKSVYLSDFVQEYLEYIHNRKKYKPGAIQTYEYSLQLLMEIIGDIPLNRVNRVLVDKKILPALEGRLATATVRHHMINFRSAFSKAVEWGYLKKNPFFGMVPNREKKVPRYFTKEEIEKMRDYLLQKKIPRWQYDLIFLALNTGLRKSELLNLLWEHVDLENEILHFPGKGNKERIVPLNTQALEILRGRKRRSGRVFFEIKDRAAIDSAWRRLKKRTGINGRFHDLRKTYASYFVMNGGSLEHLREILGHEDFETVKIYKAFSPDSIQKDKNVINF